MNQNRGRWAALVAGALSAGGCTDFGLFVAATDGPGPFDDTLAIETRFCTEDPATLEFPVKILFVVDTSQSMNVTDPTGGRLSAVQEVVDNFLDDPGTSFAIIQFSGQTNVLTQGPDGEDGFTRDREALETAIVRLGVAEQPTDYEGAIANVNRVLSRDMANASEQALSRSRYIVVFLSDGLPDPVRPPTNTRSSILRRVREISDLQRIYRPREIRFHTALLLGALGTGFRCADAGLEGGVGRCSALNTAPLCEADRRCTWISVEQEATSLLEGMAAAGSGTFRSFPNGESINFLRIDFTSIRRIFALKSLVVSNLNARPRFEFPLGIGAGFGRAVVDSDGDGLSDERELELGTSLTSTDTDDDGFSDLLEVRLSASGFDPLDPSDADCTPGLDRLDTDGDGLLDCEERFFGTNRNRPDGDADGLPDVVELMGGSNPVANDLLADNDFDGARNGAEVRAHSDPNRPDSAERSQISYRYSIVRRSPEDLAPTDARQAVLRAGRECYEARVENVTLAPTLDGKNRIMIYVTQAPFDDPEDFGELRVACVEPSFFPPDTRLPPLSTVFVPESAYVRPEAFRRSLHCTTGEVPPPRDERCVGPIESLDRSCFEEGP